ncbi:MAG TPA: hypothetical protein VF283_17935, partial [Bryobacteraceae bacterium]
RPGKVKRGVLWLGQIEGEMESMIRFLMRAAGVDADNRIQFSVSGSVSVRARIRAYLLPADD